MRTILLPPVYRTRTRTSYPPNPYRRHLYPPGYKCGLYPGTGVFCTTLFARGLCVCVFALVYGVWGAGMVSAVWSVRYVAQ